MRSTRTASLPRELRAGDLVVVNDAATLPSLLRATTAGGEPVEVRLAAHVLPGNDPSDADVGNTMAAVLFGAGDTTMRTEERGAPPRVAVGDKLKIGESLEATVVSVSAKHARLCTLQFSRARMGSGIFEVGVPVQYAYIEKPLSIHHVTPVFAAEPWAFEPASAGLTLDFHTLAEIRAGGVDLATITHAAGLSSLGDPELDGELPFPELSRVSKETADRVRVTKANGGRVVAIGTTVTRALESAAVAGTRLIEPRAGLTSLRLSEAYELRVVDAVLTGMHVPGESHHELLAAFQDRDVLLAGCELAERLEYRSHEFGDTMLVFARDRRVGSSG